MVAFVKNREFQGFFAKGCVLLHVLIAVWRFCFERKLEDLAWDWLRQAVGDLAWDLATNPLRNLDPRPWRQTHCCCARNPYPRL
ncbi:hypothetical protein L1049_018400 [Liquidambar formosana]|uniref:DUF7865 domain-containing protein n=1 Tax=Liquidambar formosana TaxID=63359 RepID=A0AAP0RAA5_LIQFO